MTNPNQEHIDEFRANDGKLGGYLEGASMLLLHHVGSKSGKEYVAPLTYQAVDSGYAIFASNYGKTSDPAWFGNLKANPTTTIEIGPDTVSVRARITDSEERDRIFAEQVRLMPPFAEYVESSQRVIPVVVLERV
jgi:deazaflavin-dependent oxidoreductase (nitroreductase family)